MCEDEKIIDNFKYWFETNTENGVSTIPDFICKKLLNLCQQEKEKNKELEKEMELNKEAIYLANNTICNYDIGYQDGLNKKMTATEIVAERRKFMILGQKINQLENANYELHKKIDEGNKKVVEDYISKDKIKEIIKQLENDIKKTRDKKYRAPGEYISDYDKVRLKAYITKTEEIKKRLQELVEEN